MRRIGRACSRKPRPCGDPRPARPPVRPPRLLASQQGNSALHQAVREGHQGVVQLLLRCAPAPAAPTRLMPVLLLAAWWRDLLLALLLEHAQIACHRCLPTLP